MSDYGEYNGNTGHDMWVDYTYHENTGELNDWYSGGNSSGSRSPRYRSDYQPKKSTLQLIYECKSRIQSNKANITIIEAKIARDRKQIENPDIDPKKKAQLQAMLDMNYPNRLARHRKNIEKDEAKLTSLLIKREKERNRWTIGICSFAIVVSIFTFWIIYS